MITFTEEAKLAMLDGGSGNWGAVFNGALTMFDRGRELTVLAGENISAYDLVYLLNGIYPITAVDIDEDKFTLAGALSSSFIVGNKFNVIGSTGNDGVWTIESSTEIAGPSTEIVVTGDVTSAVANGRIHLAKAYKARANLASTLPAIGMAIAEITSGMNGKIRMVGWIDNPAWVFVPGSNVYLSAVIAGGLSANPVSPYNQKIGMMKSPTRLLLNIQSPDANVVCYDNQVVCYENEIVVV